MRFCLNLCQKWDCKLIEFNGELDHIHLLFQYYPQMDLSKFVNNIKSVSSRRIRSEFPDHVNQIYWKDVLWNESYFIASCGGVRSVFCVRTSKIRTRPTRGISRLFVSASLRLSRLSSRRSPDPVERGASRLKANVLLSFPALKSLI